MMAHYSFWVCLITVVYAYAGYPVLLFLLSKMFKKPVKKRPSERSVSIIVSAFNEESAIEQKLLNLLDLDYPEDGLEILVGSDGARDQTDAIVGRFKSPRVRFFRFVQNLGKPNVLTSLVEEARGEIIVFTDVRQMLDRAAIQALVSNFEDPQVGCVSGELCFRNTAGEQTASVGSGMDAYWRYEKFLRKRESQMGSMLGATGAIYAIRKSLFPKWMPEDILVDDMYIPFEAIRRGYRAVFESEAKAFDQPSREGAQEFKRKVRTLAGNYQIFAHFPGLFLPGFSSIAWQLFSHKFLRLLAPFFLIGLFLSNFLFLSEPLYLVFFIAQIVFYGLAGFEILSSKLSLRKKGIGYIPYTFCLLNYSAIVGLFRFLQRKQKVNWERAYV